MSKFLGFDFVDWAMAFIVGTLTFIFADVKMYLGGLVLLSAVNMALGTVVNCWLLGEEWVWKKFYTFPVQIIVMLMVLPALNWAQTTFPDEFFFDAKKYMALIFTVALISSILVSAGKPFKLNFKKMILEKLNLNFVTDESE